MKQIFVVILNWNGKENTIACLESISRLDTSSFSLTVIVVDNASTDDSIPVIKKSFPKTIVLKNPENIGFGEGMNTGILYSVDNHADYVLLLNNDTVVDKHLLVELLSVMESDKTIGVVAPKIYFEKGYEFDKSRYKKEELGKVFWYAGGLMDWNNVIGSHRGVDAVDVGQYETIKETDFASGCCMLVKTDVFTTVGVFDRRYFLYYEDADLSERIKKAGRKVLFCPKGYLWHKNAGSAGGSGSSLQDYYITRNRLLFGMTYAPIRAKISLLRESISMFFSGRRWQKVGVKDFYFGRFGKGSYL